MGRVFPRHGKALLTGILTGILLLAAGAVPSFKSGRTDRRSAMAPFRDRFSGLYAYFSLWLSCLSKIDSGAVGSNM